MTAPAGIETRPATEEDAAAIALAHIDSIRALGPRFYPLDVVEAWCQDLTADVYTNAMRGGEAFFVATGYLDGQQVVLGFATHRVDDDQDGASVYVRGRAARQGIGTALLRLAEQHARAHGAASIQIQASLAGVAFYRVNGFEELGRSEAVLRSGKSMACVLMRKQLRQPGRGDDGTSVLLDELMPRYDVAERHQTLVRAAPSVVYASIREADLAGGPATRLLFALRAVPAVTIAMMRSPRAALAEWRERRAQPGLRLADFERAGFRIVGERTPEELVIGLLGRFWTPRGALREDVSVETFRDGPPAGEALAGWNFSVHARPDGLTELRTETRVWCAPDAWPRFRLYWVVVRPGSGLIRRSMLQAIRRRAERIGGDASRPRYKA